MDRFRKSEELTRPLFLDRVSTKSIYLLPKHRRHQILPGLVCDGDIGFQGIVVFVTGEGHHHRFEIIVSDSSLQGRGRRRFFLQSELVQQLEEFANNKDKRSEVIKAWTEIKEHPEAQDMNSPVGSAFDKEDLDEELRAAFEAIGEDGMIYSSFEHSFWIRHKGQLIRVM